MSILCEQYIIICLFLGLIIIGFAAVSIHYRNKYEEVMEQIK